MGVAAFLVAGRVGGGPLHRRGASLAKRKGALRGGLRGSVAGVGFAGGDLLQTIRR
jgi:hypothetical protein